MSAASAEGTEPLRRALDAVAPLVDAVGEAQWSAPTPCERWDVRTLLNHLVGGNLLFVALLTEQPPPDYRADHLGSDPSASYRRSADRLVEAFGGEGVMERNIDAPIGRLPGLALVHVRTIETLAHGWDLAVAIGQPAALPNDLAEAELELAKFMMGQVKREGRFGAEHAVAADAPALDQLVALLGRNVADPVVGRG